MKKSFFLLLVLTLVFSNCAKDQSNEELNFPNFEAKTLIHDTETESKAPCHSFPTLHGSDYFGPNGGSSYTDALISSLNTYANCVSTPISTEYCGGNWKPGGTVTSSINTCSGYIVGSCTNEDGVVTWDFIMPQTFNPETYVEGVLNGAECNPGCAAIPTNVIVTYVDGPLCLCGINSEYNDPTIPCDQLQNPEFTHFNGSISVEVSYICCCVGPAPDSVDDSF